MKMKEFGPPGGVPGAPPWISQWEVFTLNQFLSVYWAQWVTYSFTLKFCAVVSSTIQYQ